MTEAPTFFQEASERNIAEELVVIGGEIEVMTQAVQQQTVKGLFLRPADLEDGSKVMVGCNYHQNAKDSLGPEFMVTWQAAKDQPSQTQTHKWRKFNADNPNLQVCVSIGKGARKRTERKGFNEDDLNLIQERMSLAREKFASEEEAGQ